MTTLALSSHFSTLFSRGARPGQLVVPEGLGALPLPLRLVLADVVSNVLEGERAAVHAATRLARLDGTAEGTTLAEQQARDERLHVAFFELVQAELGVQRTPNGGVVRLMRRVHGAQTLSALLLCTQLVIETVGHALFEASASALGRVSKLSWLAPDHQRTLAQLGEGFEQVQRDESRHLAYGVLRLRDVREGLTRPEQQAFDTEVRSARVALRRAFWWMPLLLLLRPLLRVSPARVLAAFDARAAAVGVGS